MQTERHIPLQGATNFRDFGGYAGLDGRRVKWRRLFRSDRLSELTAQDYANLDAHGIRAVFDLRRISEAAGAPTNWLSERPPALIASPLFPDSPGSAVSTVAQSFFRGTDAEESRRRRPRRRRRCSTARPARIARASPAPWC
jgi:hypothetical protein